MHYGLAVHAWNPCHKLIIVGTWIKYPFIFIFLFSSQICWDIAWDHKLICHYTWHGGACNSKFSDQICKLQFIAFINKCQIFYIFMQRMHYIVVTCCKNKKRCCKIFLFYFNTMPVTDAIICSLCINANIKCFKRNLFFTFVIMK